MKKTFNSIFICCLLAIVLTFGLASCGSKCDHAYDNACDATCNECSEVREVGAHDYNAADCDTPKTCKICGATDGDKADHTYDNDCDTVCNACDNERTITHDFSALAYDDYYHCTKCSVCGDLEGTDGEKHVFDKNYACECGAAFRVERTRGPEDSTIVELYNADDVCVYQFMCYDGEVIGSSVYYYENGLKVKETFDNLDGYGYEINFEYNESGKILKQADKEGMFEAFNYGIFWYEKYLAEK